MVKLASWKAYQKKVRTEFSSISQNRLKLVVEKNTINVARAGLAAEALARLLIKKKIISVKELKSIINQELKKARV